jgi:putative FmdB family regulatory protein
MPLYEYQCDTCGHRFEVIQKFSDGPIETCPTCGGAVGKLLSSPAIQFKGSGWYITDYARAGTSEGSVAAGKTEASATGGESKADSKPAETKADPKVSSTSSTSD